MTSFLKIKCCLTAAGLVVALTGCGPSPLLRAGNRVFNFGTELSDKMVNRHVAGWVAFDEEWAGNYHRIARNVLYGQGVEKDKPEYGYRIARINLSQPGSALWIGEGELMFMAGAYVPDHLPRLHAGDIVEIRQTGTWMTMEEFAARGEGNIVVRILCKKADPDFEQCLEQAPKIGRFKGFGETHTSYPASVRDYGFTFTPMFDAKGTALRSYPQATITAAH